MRKLLHLIFVISLLGCEQKQKDQSKVDAQKESKPDSEIIIAESISLEDTNAPHLIFLTEGYLHDNVTVIVNNKPVFKGLVHTRESLGLAATLNVYDSIIHSIKIKVVGIVDTVYVPTTNSKFYLFSKEPTGFKIRADNRRPIFI